MWCTSPDDRPNIIARSVSGAPELARSRRLVMSVCVQRACGNAAPNPSAIPHPSGSHHIAIDERLREHVSHAVSIRHVHEHDPCAAGQDCLDGADRCLVALGLRANDLLIKRHVHGAVQLNAPIRRSQTSLGASDKAGAEQRRIAASTSSGSARSLSRATLRKNARLSVDRAWLNHLQGADESGSGWGEL